MASSPNSRASLLAGLRTGGVRSPSTNLPHSAAPTSVSFNISPFLQDDHLSPSLNKHNHIPLNPNSVPFSPGHFNNQSVLPQNQLQNQAIQLQLLQLEMMRIQSQALQAQQVQAELIAQAQRQQQAQPQIRERRTSFNPPATAAPHITAFDLRSATLSAQMRRANQTEQLKAQLGLHPAQPEDQVPMTAALGGRFGGRVSNPHTSLSRYVIEEPEEYVDPSPAAKLSLTNPSLAPPSRSDQVANWRRGAAGGNVNLGGSYRTLSSPAVRITPPQADNQRSSPPPPMSARGRPQPLHINPAASQPLVTVTVVDTTEEDEAEATSPSVGSVSLRSDTSSPITPPSHLSPREEATKKLYEGLGIGRPLPSATFQPQQHPYTTTNHRMVSQPMRQPRGPPSGADELGPKNFATRIRRQAIGGLGMLMGARERRESFIEAY